MADEELSKKEQERERGRPIQRSPSSHQERSNLRKRSRSMPSFSSSSDSVSTISTNKSVSPKRRRHSPHDDYVMSQEVSTHRDLSNPRRGKRRRSISTSSSESDYHSRDNKRNTNRRRRRQTISPHSRGRPLHSGWRRSRSRSESVDKSRVVKGRKSLTPASPQLSHRYEDVPKRSRRKPSEARPEHRNWNSHGNQTNVSSQNKSGKPRDRSLSPYSRRLALTQAMNTEK